MLIAEKEWYKDWFNSAYYHKLYFERDEQEAESFIRLLISKLQPEKGSRMLDVACGKGRHSRILAGMDFNVTGIDIAEQNIQYARQFENENLEFFQHDMRLPFRINYFNYALNFFTSFGYFKTQREHEDAIRTIAESIVAGGSIVIDYLNVHFAENQLVYQEDKIIDGIEYHIRRWHDDTHFYKKITVKDPSNPIPQSFTEQVAKFSPGDFNDMLSFHGMQVTELFGDYKLGKYDLHSSPRMILVAKKVHEESVSEEEKRLYSDGRTTDALT